MFIILMGPGAGKDSSGKINKEFALIHVSTGDIFRNAVKEMRNGEKGKGIWIRRACPDEIVLGIVKKGCQNLIVRLECARGLDNEQRKLWTVLKT